MRYVPHFLLSSCILLRDSLTTRRPHNVIAWTAELFVIMWRINVSVGKKEKKKKRKTTQQKTKQTHSFFKIKIYIINSFIIIAIYNNELLLQ